MAQTRSNTSFVILALMIILVAAAGVLTIPALGSIQLRTHAVEHHQADADIAREWIGAHAGPGNRYDCPDGRTRIVSGMPGGKWAVMVLEAGVEVTSFITPSQDYIRKILDPCEQFMKFAHP